MVKLLTKCSVNKSAWFLHITAYSNLISSCCAQMFVQNSTDVCVLNQENAIENFILAG